ncbi:substrate-binding domain-containing protein [Streptomyces sp. NPDC088747]|uniref:caspase, EACC1-associated type n=1 Tax=Streptomyces sp. NPDC088747 TaxID=3365886 RepID=UPI0037F4C436
MPHQSDAASSRAVLIGSYAYRNMDDLPAVENNVRRLGELFREPALLGMPKEHCLELVQPTRDDVFDTVHKAAAGATDTLVLYFAGHGLADPDTGELYLALHDSRQERLDRAVRYEDVRRVLLRPAAMGGTRARRKVVILDCCWSGLALGGAMAEVRGYIGAQASIEGTFVLTATAETRQALAPAGKRYTAFTGELIEAIAQGIPSAPELLSMADLYDHLDASLTAKSLPRPQQRNRNSAGNISLFRNQAFRPPEPPAPKTVDHGPSPAATPTVTPSVTPPLTSVAFRRTTKKALLPLCAAAMGGAVAVSMWLAISDEDTERTCVPGKLTLIGSTAFAPVLSKAAEAYERSCPEAHITVDSKGSAQGLVDLDKSGQEEGSGSPQLLAFSDGLKTADFPQLLPHPIASTLYTFVVNDRTGIRDLSSAQIRDLYDGVISNWQQVGGNDHPVRLVNPLPGSGSRQIFQRQILGGGRQLENNSDDCEEPAAGTSADVVSCERRSAQMVLDTVAGTAGALGYGPASAASDRDDLLVVRINGHRASTNKTSYGAYPFTLRTAPWRRRQRIEQPLR